MPAVYDFACWVCGFLSGSTTIAQAYEMSGPKGCVALISSILLLCKTTFRSSTIGGDMAKNQPRYFTLGSTQMSELRDLAGRGNGFFYIGASEIPSIIPERLRQKWDSAAVIVSPSAGAMAIVGHRIDQKAGMMDHDPFLIAVSASMPYGNGVLIHHASYDGRSVRLPSSSMGANYFRDHSPFGLSSGSTGQLPATLFHAFDIAHRALSSTSAT